LVSAESEILLPLETTTRLPVFHKTQNTSQRLRLSDICVIFAFRHSNLSMNTTSIALENAFGIEIITLEIHAMSNEQKAVLKYVYTK
jgi:hypothetical protein